MTKKTIAHVKCQEGDPNGPPMTLEQAAASIKADQNRMLRELEQQLEAHFERQAGVTEH